MYNFVNKFKDYNKGIMSNLVLCSFFSFLVYCILLAFGNVCSQILINYLKLCLNIIFLTSK